MRSSETKPVATGSDAAGGGTCWAGGLGGEASAGTVATAATAEALLVAVCGMGRGSGRAPSSRPCAQPCGCAARASPCGWQADSTSGKAQ